MTDEIWKPIKGYEGLYEVSNLGRVKSLSYNGPDRKNKKEKILRPAFTGRNKNYSIVSLYAYGKRKLYMIHDLVLQSFVGDKPDNITVDHIDMNPKNNRLENIEYVSMRENISRARKKRGNHSSKFTGVSWNKDREMWSAFIFINGKNKNIGCFKNELEAKEAYDKALEDHLNEVV